MEWMLMPYRRYAEFSGRSRRMEYWMFALLFIVVYAVCYGFLLAVARGGAAGLGGLASIPALLLLIFVLLSIVPAWAVTVRRFHDQDKSGWLVLLNFIPFIGGLILLVFMCLDGTPGPNRFGPDPQGRFDAEVFA